MLRILLISFIFLSNVTYAVTTYKANDGTMLPIGELTNSFVNDGAGKIIEIEVEYPSKQTGLLTEYCQFLQYDGDLVSEVSNWQVCPE